MTNFYIPSESGLSVWTKEQEMLHIVQLLVFIVGHFLKKIFLSQELYFSS